MDTAPHRIVSLLPAATEIVAALGLRQALVGRSHECDEPADVRSLPSLTAPRIDPGASSGEIHAAVGWALEARPGSSAALFTLDIERLAALAPDVILTQAACNVCAIASDDVAAAVRTVGHPVWIVPLSPTTLADVFADVLTVGAATGTLARAREVVARLRARAASVSCRVQALRLPRPRVAIIEWLDPPMAAGNWVPDLVRLAGGDDVLGKAGGHSHWITWDDVAAADPDVVILSPCGFTLDRIVADSAAPAIRGRLDSLRAARSGRLFAVDGHHLLNRPGPRLLDSLEVLSEILHPDGFSFAATERFARRL